MRSSSLLLLLQIFYVTASHAGPARGLRGLQEGCSFPLVFHVNSTQAPIDLSLGIAVRSSNGDSTEFITGDMPFKPNATTNVTFPLLPCGASIYGIVVRVTETPTTDKQAPASGELLLDLVEGTYNGRYKRSVDSADGWTVYWGKVFIPFGRVPGVIDKKGGAQ